MSLAVLYIGYATLATLNLCKIAQEHGAGLAHEPFPILRSRTYFYPLQWLFSPFNIHYHYEHHANFNVPGIYCPVITRSFEKLSPRICDITLFIENIGHKCWAPKSTFFSTYRTTSDKQLKHQLQLSTRRNDLPTTRGRWIGSFKAHRVPCRIQQVEN